MKPMFVISVAGLLLGTASSQAQYKAPSQYFRKDSPKSNPGTPPGTPQPPGKAELPKKPTFKELPLNTQFYFLSDTNRQFAWTKISEASAKNAKNGVTQAISSETPVQR